MPAHFGHWGGTTNQDAFKKEILTLKQLGIEFKKTIIWRFGEMLAREANIDTGIYEDDKLTKLYLKLAEEAIKKSPKVLTSKLNDLDFMSYTLEDYQIVLTNSIPADRIIKLIPQGNEFGRTLRREKRNGL